MMSSNLWFLFFIFVGTFYFYYGTFYEIGLDSIIAVTRINVQNMGFISQKKGYLTLVRNDLEIQKCLGHPVYFFKELSRWLDLLKNESNFLQQL